MIILSRKKSLGFRLVTLVIEEIWSGCDCIFGLKNLTATLGTLFSSLCWISFEFYFSHF